MIQTGRYYVMYNDVSYIDEHNITTNEKVRIYTGWTKVEFVTTNTSLPKLISMAIDLEYIYILYNASHNFSGVYYVNKFDHEFNFIERKTVDVGVPTSIASDMNTLYVAYTDKFGVKKVSSVDSNFIPNKTINDTITDIFGYNSELYGFHRGTITGELHKINIQQSTTERIKLNAQRNGPDYGIQRDKIYGYSSPGYLEYELYTGEVLSQSFIPSYNNYILATISTSDGTSVKYETITITESMFMVKMGMIVYPAIDGAQFTEQSATPVHNNFSTNEDLYIGE